MKDVAISMLVPAQSINCLSKVSPSTTSLETISDLEAMILSMILMDHSPMSSMNNKDLIPLLLRITTISKVKTVLQPAKTTDGATDRLLSVTLKFKSEKLPSPTFNPWIFSKVSQHVLPEFLPMTLI